MGNNYSLNHSISNSSFQLVKSGDLRIMLIISVACIRVQIRLIREYKDYNFRNNPNKTFLRQLSETQGNSIYRLVYNFLTF